MKRISLISVLALTLMAACGREGDTSKLNVSNISYTSCKSYIDREAKAHPIWGAPDSVSVSYAEGTLYVTHYNVLVNCSFKESGVIVDVESDGSTITISEHENPDGPLANCMCSTDNSFQISNIPHGTYTLVFTNWYPEPFQCTYTF